MTVDLLLVLDLADPPFVESGVHERIVEKVGAGVVILGCPAAASSETPGCCCCACTAAALGVKDAAPWLASGCCKGNPDGCSCCRCCWGCVVRVWLLVLLPILPHVLVLDLRQGIELA